MAQRYLQGCLGFLAAGMAGVVGCGDAGDEPAGDPVPESPCGIVTGHEGDELCILPPEPSEGFQIHIGPSDYDDPAQIERFLLAPHMESTECYFMKAPNPELVHYFRQQIRMRPGSHHIINYVIAENVEEGWGDCREGTLIGSLGGSQNSVRDVPEGGVLAPENEGLGMTLGAHAQLRIELHYYNPTDRPILREAWVNVFYQNDVAQRANSMFMIGGLRMAVPPNTRQVIRNRCEVPSATRLFDMFGHVHANNTRFTVWRVRGEDERLKLYETFDWEEPYNAIFDSITVNPEPDVAARRDGAFTGPVELLEGDVIEWECEIDNRHDDITLRFANEVDTAEMCNVFGFYIHPNPLLMRCFEYGEVVETK